MDENLSKGTLLSIFIMCILLFWTGYNIISQHIKRENELLKLNPQSRIIYECERIWKIDVFPSEEMIWKISVSNKWVSVEEMNFYNKNCKDLIFID